MILNYKTTDRHMLSMHFYKIYLKNIFIDPENKEVTGMVMAEHTV